MKPEIATGLTMRRGREKLPPRPDISPKAARIVEITGDLPPMPHIAAQVISKLSEPDSTARDIHSLMQKDQALAARVLKVANSPYYGASRSISTLRDACMFMGFDAIRSLIMTAVMKGMFSSVGLSEKLIWEHTVGAGLAARIIGDEVRFQRKEEAYLAGLMHDVGKAALLLRSPAVMREVMQEVYNDGADFFEVEMRTTGFHPLRCRADDCRQMALCPRYRRRYRKPPPAGPGSIGPGAYTHSQHGQLDLPQTGSGPHT